MFYAADLALFMFTNVMASGELFLSFHMLLVLELYLFWSTIINYLSQKKTERNMVGVQCILVVKILICG